MSESLVDVAWMKEHQDDPNVCLIEINWHDKNAYEEGHIPGALGWNWKEMLWDPDMRDFPTPEVFAERLGQAGISNDTTVVFYGGPVQFGTYGWWVFKYCGHKDVRMLDGGRVRWAGEGNSLTKDVPSVSPTKYKPASRNEAMRVLRDGVLDSISRDDTVILDHRSPQEYAGTMVGVPGHPDVGAERYGRIPGALHANFAEMLNEDETFKSPEQLAYFLKKQGGMKDKNIISYCRLSHRATLAYFVMRELLGYENVQCYDGSWTEWGSIVGVPIER